MACCFHMEIDGEERGCQFASETEFTTLGDGATWCRFHLPMRDAAGSPSPKAGWDNTEIDQFNRAVFAVIDTAIAAEGEDDRLADLTGGVFPGRIDFTRYDKEHPFPPVSFHRAAFSGDADFSEAAFSGYASFREAAFSRYADFSEAAFSGYAYFHEAAFSGRAYFREAAFSGDAYFSEAAFSGYAYFREAAFLGDASFSEAAFSGYANFPGAAKATGRGGRRYDMRLTGAPGDDGAWAAKGEALSPATPSRSRFQRIDFSGCTFGGPADFNNRRFTDTTSFRGAVFERAPKFHNANLHQDTDFTGTKFPDVTSENAVRNYRTLKLAMENVRARQEEAMFFAYEQRSLRKREDTPRMTRWASAIYDGVAEYGQNFVLPVLWMLFVSAAFADVYAGVLLKTRDLALATSPACDFDILAFSLRQVFRPFEVWSAHLDLVGPFACYGVPDGARMALRILATLQTLITFGLFTLFLLALRKRFRMM